MSNQWENSLTGELLDEFGNVIDQDELTDLKYCDNCHKLKHEQITDCPAFDYDFGVLNGVLTLAQFRKFTEHLSGHYQIVISDLDRNFLNVNLVSLPDDDETHVINLLTANTFDPRQI